MPDRTDLRLDRGDKPRKPWLTPIVGVAIWLGCVTLATSAICGAVWSLNATRFPTQAEIDNSLWGSREKKLSLLRETYDGRRVQISDPRRGEIEAFLRSITKPDPENQRPKWKDALDETRFRQRIANSPWMSAISLLGRRSFSTKPLDEFSINGPNESTSLELVRIEPWAPSGGDELLICTYSQRSYRETEPVLFWVRQMGGQWKLVDWEFVDSGASSAELAGMYESALAHKSGFAYREAREHLQQADALRYSNEQEFDRQLRQAEGCRVPPQVEPMIQYSIMNRWGTRQRHQEVRRMMKQIRDPERIPGTLVAMASACHEIGETEESLEIISRLEQLIGTRPELATSRAQMLEWSGRREEAIQEWQRLLNLKPDEISALMTLHKLLPKSRRGEMLDHIKAASQPAERAVQFVNYTSTSLERSLLTELRQFVQETAPGSEEARNMEVAYLRQNHDHLAAAALYRQAAEQAESEKSGELWLNYLQEMNSAGQLDEGFAHHPNPRRAFQELTRGMDDMESMISPEEMPPLLAAYRQKQPDDPWLSYYEGFVQVNQEQWAAARQSFETANKLVSEREDAQKDEKDEAQEKGDLELLKSYLKYQGCRVRYELGEDVEILIGYQYDVSVYQSLASLAIQYHHWKALERLNRAFSLREPSNGQLLLNQARALLVAKNFPAVKDKLRRVASREIQESWLKYSREQLELDRQLAEYPDPVEAFMHSTNRVGAFNTLSRRLLAERDWVNLDRLCEQHRGQGNDNSILLSRLELAWRRSDDQKLVDALTPWPEALAERFSYFGANWRERLARCLIRLGQTDEAYRRAVGDSRHFGETWPLVLVHIARRDVKSLVEMLDQDESLVDSFELKDFAEDSSLHPVLVEPEFAELRQRYRFGLPGNRAADAVLLLLKQPVELSKAWLQQRLSDGNDETSSAQITVVSPQKMIVSWKGNRFLVSSEAAPYFDAEFQESSTYRSRIKEVPPELETLFKSQVAYWRVMPLLAVDVFGWDAPVISTRELAARILPPEIVGAVNQPALSGLQAVIPLTESQSDVLASRRPLSELDTPVMLLRTSSSNPAADPATKHSLIELAGQQSANKPAMLLNVRIGPAISGLTARFRTVETTRDRYAGVELVAEFVDEQPYPGIPEIRPGIRYLIPLDQVLDIQEPQ